MIARFNKAWRLFATALCFTAFGLGGLFLAVILFPILRIVCWSEAKRTRAARKIVYHAFRLFVWFMKFLGVITTEVINFHKVAGRDGLLIIANHPTLIDVVLLMSYLPDMNCVVKKALWSNVFLAGVVRCTGYINNSEPERIVDNCVEWIKSGGSLIIFPEGSRTRISRPIVLQRGAANIAARAGKDLTPAIITCRPITLNKESPWYKIPAQRPHFKITFYEDIKIKSVMTDTENYALASRRITRVLEEFFKQEVLVNE